MDGRTRDWLRSGLVGASLVVVGMLAASFALSVGLPAWAPGVPGCAWSDALIPVVACDGDAGRETAREAFLNAWHTGLVWSPLFSAITPFSILAGEGPVRALLQWPLVLLPGIASWGAVAVLARAAWPWLRRGRT